jgi:hypothetical protein
MHTDKASMLDEIIDYVKFLRLQVKVCSPPPSPCFTMQTYRRHSPANAIAVIEGS